MCFTTLKTCPLCTTKLAYRNNKAAFFSKAFYKPGKQSEIKVNEKNNDQEELPAKRAPENENGENRLRQVQEIEAENLAADMGDL